MKVAAFIILSALFSLPLAAKDKPCISFSGNSPLSSTDIAARDYLQTATTLGGDYDFQPTTHVGCWAVNVLSMSIPSTDGYSLGYVISWTVTRDNGFEIDHGVRVGATTDIFDTAMRSAAAAAIANIRLTNQLSAASKKFR